MIRNFDEFTNEEWNPLKKKVVKREYPEKEGYIKFEKDDGSFSYLKDWDIETICGAKGKISEIFSGLGTDEDGRFIANCKKCDSNGVEMRYHIKHYGFTDKVIIQH